MDHARAEELIEAERQRVQRLLATNTLAASDDRDAAAAVTTSILDVASPLEQESVDDAVVEQLMARLAALDRATARLSAGMFGRSVLSGRPVPDERLEADPAAELTVDEADGGGRDSRLR